MKNIKYFFDDRIICRSQPATSNECGKIFDLSDGLEFTVDKFGRDPEHHSHEDEHTHNFIELIYTAQGSATHYISGKPYRVSRGDLLFINCGEVHSFDIHEKTVAYNFLIKPEFISKNLVNSESINDIFLALLPDSAAELQKRKTPCVHFSANERIEIERAAETMYHEIFSTEPCSTLILNSHMRLLFAKLIRELLRSTSFERPNILTDEIIAYLDANFTTPITASALAEHCFYNPAYLGRVFKAVYGKSIKEYLRNKRMEYSMYLITETDMPIDEIYLRSGYCSKAQFYKNFKEYFGDTPKKFREGK